MSQGSTSVVRFLLNGKPEAVSAPDPTSTLLSHLRYERGLTGTKEGCAEGDCGACTVLAGALGPDGESLRWSAVNACIQFLPMMHGKAVLTVEGITEAGAPGPVQQAMIDSHGSQCGFCTPGFVMSLHGRAIGASGTVGTPLADVLAGNLCRCTGYGPILEAGAVAAHVPQDDAATIAALKDLAGGPMLAIDHDGRGWRAPRTSDELASVMLERPNACIVAGATDVGLWVTKQLRVLDDVVAIGAIGDLQTIEETEAALILGAGVRYTDAAPALARLHPELGELVRRIGGLQVRNAGTIGGNIANGSPIGDTPPALIALGARVVLRRGEERRTLPLEDFFIAYGKQDRAPGEFVERLIVPRPTPQTLVRIVKLSKRFDSDITAVCGAFAITFANGRVSEARIAFGGMAGTPARARACEAALIGQPWSDQTLEAAAAALIQDYAPLTDLRGTSRYRRAVAANLVRGLIDESEPRLLELEPVDG
jgi:xanthine dehydrogenase small subunit